MLLGKKCYSKGVTVVIQKGDQLFIWKSTLLNPINYKNLTLDSLAADSIYLSNSVTEHTTTISNIEYLGYTETSRAAKTKKYLEKTEKYAAAVIIGLSASIGALIIDHVYLNGEELRTATTSFIIVSLVALAQSVRFGFMYLFKTIRADKHINLKKDWHYQFLPASLLFANYLPFIVYSI